MSLLHPTPGQVLDRISILNLKIRAYREAGRPFAALDGEWGELMVHLQLLWPKVADGETDKPWRTNLHKLNQALAAVNCEIWKDEDEVRLLEGTGWDKDLVTCHIHIAKLNDERMRLVREIDKAFGWNDPVEEKIYAGGEYGNIKSS